MGAEQTISTHPQCNHSRFIMMSGLVLSCLLAFAAAAPNPFGTGDLTPFGNDTEPYGIKGDQDIINGRNSRYGYFNYILLFRGNGQFLCGASLISSTRGLTAAHCILKDVAFSVVAGELDRSQNDGYEVSRNVKSVVKHPSYVNFYRYDIAVLKFDSIPNNQYVKPIPRFTDADGDPTTLTCYIAGWGRTIGNDRYSSSDVLKYGHMLVLTTAECRAKFGNSITDAHVCVQKYSYERSACNGDSGGPLECYVPGSGYKLLGVTSYGRINCPGAEFPTVYTRVPAYESWINSHL